MIFEKASRLRLRFDYKGQISVEDLWSLEVTVLDIMFKRLNSEAKARKGESLLIETKADTMLDLAIDIIKHIVATKLQEQKEQQELVSKFAYKQKVLAIIAEKKDGELKDMSIKDLEETIK